MADRIGDFGWAVSVIGYAADGRTLRVVASEAETVRRLFEGYLALGTIPALKAACDHHGLKTPTRTSKTGNAYGNQPLTRGYLHKLLSNPLYAGKIRHGDVIHNGQHEAIIDEKLFDAVQAQLSRRGSSRRQRTDDRPKLLGKLVDDQGAPLKATHAKKGSKR